jgi:hypothetical protein
VNNPVDDDLKDRVYVPACRRVLEKFMAMPIGYPLCPASGAGLIFSHYMAL